jgi:2-polyprenyl-3-methyl-5-hydroxy-6-metoxy-1,4-benzoquinol methylase
MTEYSQFEMVHRLPPARLVDRFEFLRARAAGRRVVHVGFVDAGCQELNTASGAWLHEHLAGVARTLVGLDVDDAGVADARARGYEAHVVDCRDVAAIRAAGIEPADVVVAGEVIEHLDDPGSFLDGLHGLVAPDGVLIVTTPNASGLVNALGGLVNLEVNHPDHVSSFTCHTLDQLLTRHAWQPVEHDVFVQSVKPGDARSARARVLTAGARAVTGLARLLAKAGRPYVAGGLIVVARPAPTRDAQGSRGPSRSSSS